MSKRIVSKPRYAVLRKVQTQFIAKGHPRLVVATLLAAAGLTAFGASVLLLGAGIDAMGLRYLIATLIGYAAFLGLIRVWIAVRRRGIDIDVPDLTHIPDVSLPGPGNAAFSGGSSGGGGASAQWARSDASLPGISLDVDADEGLPALIAIVVVGAFALGAMFALWYVVTAAPLLLAEVALDAALVTGLYRRLRKEDVRHWLGSAIRHTWKPALVVAVCLAIGGAIGQWLVPSARSIGDLFRQL